MGEEIKLSDPAQVSFIINLIVNGITCPFTVLINVLVIMAVKRRRRLQGNSNILLACLAATAGHIYWSPSAAMVYPGYNSEIMWY